MDLDVFLGGEVCPNTIRFDFDGDAYQDHGPQFLDLDQNADPEIRYCPAQLISFSLVDISSYLKNLADIK